MDTVPDEILSHILKHTNFKEIIAIMLVCKRFTYNICNYYFGSRKAYREVKRCQDKFQLIEKLTAYGDLNVISHMHDNIILREDLYNMQYLMYASMGTGASVRQTMDVFQKYPQLYSNIYLHVKTAAKFGKLHVFVGLIDICEKYDSCIYNIIDLAFEESCRRGQVSIVKYIIENLTRLYTVDYDKLFKYYPLDKKVMKYILTVIHIELINCRVVTTTLKLDSRIVFETLCNRFEPNDIKLPKYILSVDTRRVNAIFQGWALDKLLKLIGYEETKSFIRSRNTRDLLSHDKLYTMLDVMCLS